MTLNVAVAPGLLGNDTDVDGDTLTALLVNGPSHGTLTWNANGSFSYTPAAQYSGSDSFTYRAQDSSGALSSLVTVSLTVTAPTLSINNVSANEGTLTTPFNFTVTLSSPTSRTITVNYATANGTATAGILPFLLGDYTSYERHADLHERTDQQDGHRVRHRGCGLRAQRDILRQPVHREHTDRRQPGTGDDPQRRHPACDRRNGRCGT